MLTEILESIRKQQEAFTFAGKRMICVELGIDDDLGVEVKTEADAKRLEDEAVYRLMVRSVFFDVGEGDAHVVGERVFTDDDIAELRNGGKSSLGQVLAIVRRVNGLDGNANAKK